MSQQVLIALYTAQFPYMERGSKRPDAPKLAQATVRAAVIEASRLVPELALVAGGKSFGGRMTSQAQAASPLPGVRGLVFLEFPLHPPGQGNHLFEVKIPMLFLQGIRDALADTNVYRRSSSNSARGQLSSCFWMPIIPFMCPFARDAAMLRSDPRCWMR
jgi:predicted alpha/beta-hydrolase family hydrolase